MSFLHSYTWPLLRVLNRAKFFYIVVAFTSEFRDIGHTHKWSHSLFSFESVGIWSPPSPVHFCLLCQELKSIECFPLFFLILGGTSLPWNGRSVGFRWVAASRFDRLSLQSGITLSSSLPSGSNGKAHGRETIRCGLCGKLPRAGSGNLRGLPPTARGDGTF